MSELTIRTLRQSESAELSLLGQRLKNLWKLTLLYGNAERLDFLQSFPSIRALRVLYLSGLKDYSGIGHCRKLTELDVSASVSSVGSLAFLRNLPELERLKLEGPYPSKGFDEIQPLRKVQKLSLYAPRWNIERLPLVFPAVEDLYISQGGYRSLDFIKPLKNLKALSFYYARKLTTFDAIGRLPRLRTFKVGHAITGFQSCSQFGCSSTVEYIEITACKKLRDISPLLDWPALKTAKIYDCPLVSDAQINMLRKAGRIVNGK